MIPLSPKTQEKLTKLFPDEDRKEAEELLVHFCADNLPFCEREDKFSMERIRFAVMKLSEGDLEKLALWIDEAMIDARDVLVAAGFARSTKAHETWEP